MKSTHQRTLTAIFSDPIQSSIEWRKIESLFAALGAEIVEGAGSRVRFMMRGEIATFHRPHPRKEAKPYQVRDARAFLHNIGIAPGME
ncbi:type II toxin-antitoxin system HicA family toxin [Herbaspirillum sp. alder98]|uniref:type II toxin-antitoxin system HicA family toxin n=1 Tax=Herbaspirillum sp. alder98 TaxID=2913096 RepID=UPI001CD8F793|nr:type II toxin-antitoxin system HicA family toxin [Herbaspirillum sp. alder98]MCA1324112.1 type II toxin-antitoxin system HicA family toxin [Herbaspirillum sp. alder98]